MSWRTCAQRSASSNRTLLEAAAALAPEGVTVRLSEHLATLPHFNPELDGPIWRRWWGRRATNSSDALTRWLDRWSD
jgi:NAD(P)H-dependent FMN reductase